MTSFHRLFNKSSVFVTTILKEHSTFFWKWAGDYFQALCNITAPAALMVRQQSSLIITPEWEYSS